MAFAVLFDTPYSDESSQLGLISPPLAPSTVSLAGHDYAIDTSFEPYRRDAFRHRSIPAQRESVNYNNEAGEATLNTEGLWRRGMDDWTLGSGQIYLDRKGSSSSRYLKSKGVNPWTPFELTLLPDTKNVFSLLSNESFIKAIGVGLYVYWIRKTIGVFYTNSWSATPLAPTVVNPPATYNDITTDGNDIWVATSNGIWTTTVGSNVLSQYVTSGSWDSIAYVNDRLMASQGPQVFNIIAGGTPPTPLYTHPNSSWVWTHYAGGNSQVYMAGHSTTGGFSQSVIGGASGIYRSTIDIDGTTLIPPVVTLPLEGGEIATCLGSYLNFIFVGTNLGVRMCRTLSLYDPASTSGQNGDLEAGALIPNITQPVNAAVTGIVGSGRFVYFSWNNYDSQSTGLGRMDLSQFIDNLTPAYTSDLMITPGIGNIILDWDPITNGPLMSLQGNQGVQIGGIWTQDANNVVPSGTVDSGYITYGLSDDKVAMILDARITPPLSGSMSGYLSVDQAQAQNYSLMGNTFSTRPRNPWTINQVRGELFQVQIQLNAPTTRGNAGPILSRWILKSYPAIATGIEISVVLLLSREVEDIGINRYYDPYAEYAYLENLRQTQQVVTYVEGPFVREVIISSLDWLPNLRQAGSNFSGYNADLICYLKTLVTND